MKSIYPFFISFIIIFLSEFCDKTQILMLSFASKSKLSNVLIGIAIGTFFSHGIAIIFGSSIGVLQNEQILNILKILTYITFIVIGVIGLVPNSHDNSDTENKFIKKISNLSINYIFIIAITIFLGELGDKTFLSSIGLGLKYPNYKLSLITGSVLGMVVSNFVAIIFGRFLERFISEKYVTYASNLIFIIFGIIGLIS